MRKCPFCTFSFLVVRSTLSIPIRQQPQWGLTHLCLDWPSAEQTWGRFHSPKLKRWRRGRKKQSDNERLATEFQLEDEKLTCWCRTEAWSSDMSSKEHWRTEDLNNEGNPQQCKPPVSSLLSLTAATLLYVPVKMLSCESFIVKPLSLIAEFVVEWTFENASIQCC